MQAVLVLLLAARYCMQMLLSTFHLMPFPEAEGSERVLPNALRLAELSEELGFAHLWLSEHHGTRYSISTSPLTLAAALSQRTCRVGIGLAVAVTPLHHPVRLAEEIALVDHLSGGRLIAGFGIGYAPREYAAYGADMADRHARGRECVELVRRLWREDEVTVETRFHHLRRARLVLKPLQRPHPPIVIGTGSAAGAASLIDSDFGILVSGPSAMVRERSAPFVAGVPTGTRRVGALLSLFVHEPGRDPSAMLRSAARCYHAGNAELCDGPPPSEDQVTASLSDFFCHGPPETILRRLEQYRAWGITEVLCSFKWGDLPMEEAVGSMRRFAQGVLPAFA